MPVWITPAILLHVGAGASWLLVSLTLLALRRAARWFLALQLAAAFATVLAGIYLWHAKHAGPQGPAEHLLTIGTFCAFVALGLQLPIAGPGLFGGATAKLETGGFAVSCLGAVFLGLAAIAMVASRYG